MGYTLQSPIKVSCFPFNLFYFFIFFFVSFCSVGFQFLVLHRRDGRGGGGWWPQRSIDGRRMLFLSRSVPCLQFLHLGCPLSPSPSSSPRSTVHCPRVFCVINGNCFYGFLQRSSVPLTLPLPRFLATICCSNFAFSRIWMLLHPPSFSSFKS